MSNIENPVGWFEIPVTDLTRAKAFYEAVLDTRLDEHEMGSAKMAWFPMSETAMGAAGSLVACEGYTPSAHGVIVYFSAPDLDAAIERVGANGGIVLQGRTSIGEHGYYALMQDTEGNRIGLHSRQ
jgi:predicted enzyme related to lactoylglutathione lyase